MLYESLELPGKKFLWWIGYSILPGNYMNKIFAANTTSIYHKDLQYLTILIDGQEIDDLLESQHPCKKIKGLIPTLLDGWLEPKERQLIWERILPKKGQKTIAPVLMCPDDADLSCTLIVMEIEAKEQKILWNRVGFDMSNRDQNFPNAIGSVVDWFGNIDKLIFSRDDYLKMLQQFKNALSESAG
jgi:hypothetical protein